MTINDFTVEEINLIAIYKTDSKVETITRINNAFPMMEMEMQEIATSAVRKLNAMTNAEFALMTFVPADDG